MLSVIVAGRNDDYGKDFKERLFRTAFHNCALFEAAGIDFEYILAEWNPLPDRVPLSEEFVRRVPNARAVIIPPEIHRQYTLNPQMPFHEMAAKNAALRRAAGDVVIITNADILFTEELVRRIAGEVWNASTLYRAHRIDVKPELDWEEMQNPANQLSSGEGFLCPPYYLGAGGDFCLATRELWHSLRGFNEEIRFSTRAKDWQFFLSAAAQDVQIEFIGDVYHLDHEGGFRNTAAGELNSNCVHFGRWWDIEFGLPMTNSPEWGLGELREHSVCGDSRVVTLDAAGYSVPKAKNRRDREIMSWITRPPDSPDAGSATLLHAICVAHRQKRRLICRLEDIRLMVALSGFDALASRFGVEIFCDWAWPSIPEYNFRPFTLEPRMLDWRDWILEERDGAIRVYEYGTARAVHVLPTVMGVNEPEFNPLLARRLLRAYLELQNQNERRIGILGAGGHTEALLRWGLPDDFRLTGIFDSKTYPASGEASFDAVLLSSASFESDMMAECRRRGIRNVIALYGDWPRDLWKASQEGLEATR